jgi:hypothetical protein
VRPGRGGLRLPMMRSICAWVKFESASAYFRA